MNAFLLIALAAQTTGAPVSVSEIPAKDLRELDRCRPQRIGEASECMRRALGEATAREINTPAGERYRAAFAQLITEKWNLANRDSPVARDMTVLRVYDPSDAAYVLLVDLAARIGRYRLDYERFARERAKRPATPAAPPPAPPPPVEVKAGPLPLEQCRRPTDGPEIRIVTCTLGSDRTISRTVSGGGGIVPPDATPVSLEQCQTIGAMPAGATLKACFKLPDGRLLRQTVRTVNAPN